MKIYFMPGSKRNQSAKATYGVLPTIQRCGEDRSVTTVKSSVAAKYWRGEEEE